MGKKGSGKTLLTKQLIEKKNRLIVVDTCDEYDTGAIINDITDLILFTDRHRYKEFKVTFKPNYNQEKFAELCDLVFSIPCITFVVEELNQYCNEKRYPDTFRTLILQGRHRMIDFIGVTQRPIKIPTDFTSQLDRIYTLQQQYPEDIKKLTELFGYDESDTIRNLKSEYPQIEYFVHPERKTGLLNFS